MKFKNVCMTLITTALLVSASNILAASAGADEEVAAGANPLRLVTVGHVSVMVDLTPGDRITEYNKMIKLHTDLKEHHPVNAASDIETLANTFKAGSIQHNILFALSCVAKKLNAPHAEAFYNDVIDDIEVAANLFRFTKPAGQIIPAHLPDDEEYGRRVIEVAFSERLVKFVEMMKAWAAPHS